MPQMKPMNWIILYLIVNYLFFTSISLIYFMKKINFSWSMLFSMKKEKNFKWKW